MRRKLIFILLAIITISTLSSFLSDYMPTKSSNLLLDLVAGAVGAGNFSYWQLAHTGPIVIELTSLSGDADLYVSDNGRPSYEIDRNNFSSVTCGQDVVIIPADFPRPIGIGVFGGWAHYVSDYCIHVFLDYAKVQTMAFEFRRAITDNSEFVELREKAVPKKVDDEKPRYFLRLLNLIETLFEVAIF